MTDKQRAIEAAVAVGFAPHDDHLRRMAKSGGVDVVEVFEELGKALIMLNVPLSEVPAVVKPLTIAEVEVVVRERFRKLCYPPDYIEWLWGLLKDDIAALKEVR